MSIHGLVHEIHIHTIETFSKSHFPYILEIRAIRIWCVWPLFANVRVLSASSSPSSPLLFSPTSCLRTLAKRSVTFPPTMVTPLNPFYHVATRRGRRDESLVVTRSRRDPRAQIPFAVVGLVILGTIPPTLTAPT
jgi:hypothetical protein